MYGTASIHMRERSDLFGRDIPLQRRDRVRHSSNRSAHRMHRIAVSPVALQIETAKEGAHRSTEHAQIERSNPSSHDYGRKWC